jgi:activator of HSP90 ATPase
MGYQDFLKAVKLNYTNDFRGALKTFGFNEFLKKEGGILKAQKGAFMLPTTKQPATKPVTNQSTTSQSTTSQPAAKPTTTQPAAKSVTSQPTVNQPDSTTTSNTSNVVTFNVAGDERIEALEQECARGWTEAEYYELGSILADIGALGLS